MHDGLRWYGYYMWSYSHVKSILASGERFLLSPDLGFSWQHFQDRMTVILTSLAFPVNRHKTSACWKHKDVLNYEFNAIVWSLGVAVLRFFPVTCSCSLELEVCGARERA